MTYAEINDSQSDEAEITNVTAILVNYRTPDLAERSVDSLFASISPEIRLNAILVDGYSDDGTLERLDCFCSQHTSQSVEFLPLPLNGGYGWANNQAILKIMQRDPVPHFVFILNPDTIVLQGALEQLVRHARATPRCGAAGSLLLTENGSRVGSAFAFPTILSELVRGTKTPRLAKALRIWPSVYESEYPIEVDWVTGASVLLRTAALLEVGPFDDGFFLYFEDVELMWRLHKRGWRIWHVPESRVIHLGGASTGVNDDVISPGKLRRKPSYWYRSRDRYFTLRYGRAGAKLATSAWLVGAILGAIRSFLPYLRKPAAVDREIPDMIRSGLVPRRIVARSGSPPWKSEAGVEPAWMRNDS
jgi:GT2 family glycosyltransferase